jgi:hypothetical protein
MKRLGRNREIQTQKCTKTKNKTQTKEKTLFNEKSVSFSLLKVSLSLENSLACKTVKKLRETKQNPRLFQTQIAGTDLNLHFSKSTEKEKKWGLD